MTRSAAIVVPHLRGWLRSFPPLVPYPDCEWCCNTGMYVCLSCVNHPGRESAKGIFACDECGGQPKKVCAECRYPDMRVQVAIVLGRPIERKALLRRLEPLTRTVTTFMVQEDGTLAYSGASRRPLKPFIETCAHHVVAKREYNDRQLPLRGLR